MKKRRSRRIPRRVQAQFSAAGEDKTRVGFTSNFSEAGMFISTRRPYPVGTAVLVKLLLEEPVMLDTVVVHSVRGVGAAAGLSQSGMGLRLVKPSPQLNAVLGLSGSEAGPSTSSRTPPVTREPATAPVETPKQAVRESIAKSPPDPVDQPEATSPSANLKEQLKEAERERDRLEEMVDADDQEKRMLRQLVSKLEMRLAAESGLTRQAEERAGAGDRKIANLETALARARETRAVEPPPRAVVDQRKAPSPWLMLVAGAVLGVVGISLLPNFSPPDSGDGVSETSSPPGAMAETRDEALDPSTLLGPVAIPEIAKLEETKPAVPDTDLPAPNADKRPPADEVAEVAPAELVNPLVAAEETVRKWAAAWSEQRVEDYLDFYSSAFVPPNGLTRGEWNDQRRERLNRPQWIRVEIGAIEAASSTDDRVTLSFDQSYETPTYRDRVRKTLDLVRENEVWKIVAARNED